MSHSRSVLVVEDDENDVLLMQAAFGEIELQHPLHLVGNGRDALLYLQGAGKYSDRTAYPFPALLVLDLWLPVQSGVEVLRWLREHPELKATLRVLVITSVLPPNTEKLLRELATDEVFEKPTSYARLREQLQAAVLRWLGPDSAG